MLLKKFAVKAVEEAKGIVTAVMATLNVVDLDEDVTLPGAFGEQEAPIAPAHNWSSVPLGKAKIVETDEVAVAEMKFNLDSQAGREWFGALKFDFENGSPLQQYSYGYKILEAGKGEHDGRKVQFLKKLKVLEVSPVFVGAGINTRTLAVKSGLIEKTSIEQEFESVESSLLEAAGFYSRVKLLAGFREKEGRTLSQSNRERLSRLLSTMRDLEKDINNLLVETEVVDPEKTASLQMMWLKTHSEIQRFLRAH